MRRAGRRPIARMKVGPPQSEQDVPQSHKFSAPPEKEEGQSHQGQGESCPTIGPPHHVGTRSCRPQAALRPKRLPQPIPTQQAATRIHASPSPATNSSPSPQADWFRRSNYPTHHIRSSCAGSLRPPERPCSVAPGCCPRHRRQNHSRRWSPPRHSRLRHSSYSPLRRCDRCAPHSTTKQAMQPVQGCPLHYVSKHNVADNNAAQEETTHSLQAPSQSRPHHARRNKCMRSYFQQRRSRIEDYYNISYYQKHKIAETLLLFDILDRRLFQNDAL